jgi:hypothetical protein
MNKLITIFLGLLAIAFSQTERWVYRYDGPRNGCDGAYSVIYGGDGNIYAAGWSVGNGSHYSHYDFVVISLTTTGSERWVYRYDIQGIFSFRASSIVYGPDSNIYVTGYNELPSHSQDIVIISVTTVGSERWAYCYNGSGDDEDETFSLIYGADGNVYAVGWSYSNHYDFTIISLTATGNERWIYLNNWGKAYSLAYGADGNIYAAGYSTGSGTNEDFTVISLNPVPGIEEQSSQKINEKFNLSINTFQNQNLSYILSLPEPATVSLFLYNLSGQKILSWQINATQGISHYLKNLPKLTPGVHFLRAEVSGKSYIESRKLIVVK